MNFVRLIIHYDDVDGKHQWYNHQWKYKYDGIVKVVNEFIKDGLLIVDGCNITGIVYFVPGHRITHIEIKDVDYE